MNNADEVAILEVYTKLSNILSDISNLPVYPPLIWVWAWDIVKNRIEDYRPEMEEEHIINPALTDLDIFKLFYNQAGDNSFTLEYGTEYLDDAISNWLYKSILVKYEE